MQLKDKVAFVTGGASGIGRETALLMAAHGAKVVIGDRDAINGPRVVAEIEADGGEAIFCAVDVAEGDQVQTAVQSIVATYGRIDCAFNNAGIEGEFCPTADYSEADFQRVLAINVTGVFLCMKYEIREMLRTGGGTIVNTASITGLIGWRGAPAYSASKHAVVGLTKTAALEYARQGIRVNAVCPGVISTPMGERVASENPKSREKLTAMHPMHRLGTPSEVAKAVLWLCSDASSFTTGHTLTIDGGLVVR